MNARRDRVEHGLSPALRIAGRDPERHALSARMERYAVPGVALAVVDDGEISWAGGYGVRRTGSTEQVHATTLFQAASISKAVAAVGVLALVEHGTLDLDADITGQVHGWRLPPSEHTADRPVTLRHLLSHTAGTTVPGFPGYPVGTALPSVLDILHGTGGSATPAVESFAPPGTTTQYSGGGTTVVQQLVSDVTGRDFADLMHDLVLRPFGMLDSAYDQPIAAHRMPRAATGHDATGTPVGGGHHVYPELQAAGLWTTAVDLARWIIGVQQILHGATGGPISPSTARLMVEPVGDGPFGLGPELGGAGPHRRFGHSGSNEGFRSWMDGLVDAPVGAAILTNGAGGTTLCVELRHSLADEYGWGDIGAAPVELADVDPDVLRSYAGRYRGPFELAMRVEYADGELFAPAPYGRRRLFPLGPTTLLDEETGATLEVHADGSRVRRIAVVVDGNEVMAFEPEDPA